MKKNLLIIMMMVLCAGFVSAQTINTVRGFVPGGSTGTGNNATYVVIGQPFSMMSVANADAQAEVMVGLAQMQLITDTTMTVVGYKDGYHEHGLDLNAQELLEALDDLSTCSNGQVEGYMGFLNFQKPNLAHNNDNFEYYYDSLFVVKVFICPDSTKDAGDNKYEVIALNEKCWINSNLRTTVACGGGRVKGMIYNSELNKVTEDMLPTYGMLYTFAAATGAANNADGVQCDEETGYLQGICPCNWHLPTAEEMAPLFVLPAENLRVNGNWIVEGNNNLTGFSAEPAGFYNATFNRFEGLLTETDYWMVNCDSLENPVQDVFQLIYSCNTPLKPKHSTDDALSVRCVYDIVREFDKCENPTPVPNPDPNPQPIPEPTECAEPNGEASISSDGYSFSVTLQNVSGNTTATVSYAAVDENDEPETDANDPIPYTSFPNNTLDWEYPGHLDNLKSLVCTLKIYNAGVFCQDYVYTIIDEQPSSDCPTLGEFIVYENHNGFSCQINNFDNYNPDLNTVSLHYVVKATGAEDIDSNVELQPNNQGSVDWHYESFNDNVYYILVELTLHAVDQMDCDESYVAKNLSHDCLLDVSDAYYDEQTPNMPGASVVITDNGTDNLQIDNIISVSNVTYSFNGGSYEYDITEDVMSNSDIKLQPGSTGRVYDFSTQFTGTVPPGALSVDITIEFQVSSEDYYDCADNNDHVIVRTVHHSFE